MGKADDDNLGPISNINGEAPESDYSARKLRVLVGLEGVRVRPGMYIGATDSVGLHHMVYEIVDNSVDEALAGFCNNIEVTINEDGSVTVEDDGRGVPVDIVEDTGKSGVETVFTILHSGGKFGDGGYKVSGGLHGVGASVVNALSTRMVVVVSRQGKMYRQVYHRGKPEASLEQIGVAKKNGTRVTFWPDAEIFHDINEDNERIGIVVEFDVLAVRMREMAFLNKGLRITLADKRDPVRGDTYYYEGGIAAYVQYLNNTRTAIHEQVIYLEQARDRVVVECALQWTDSYTESIYSFVNNINTHDGGTHLTGFRNALTRIVNQYGREKNLIKENEANLSGEDVREGCSAIIAVRVPDPQFEGQTKRRLSNREVNGITQTVVAEKLSEWLELNPKAAKEIVTKAVHARQARDAVRRAMEFERKKRKFESSNLPGKLADCSERDASKCEIYLVEGDSAGGSAKQGRNRTFQAILPLRGKILNVERVQPARIYDNAEVQAMIQALGLAALEDVDEGGGKTAGLLRPNASNLDLSKLRYHKVILMTDADVDGSHIRTLLLTFFFRYARPLIENGYVYIAQPPLFKVERGKRIVYCHNEHKLEAVLAELGEKAQVQRFKGLGEMMAEQLWDTTMNPEKRTLKRVTVQDASEADHVFDLLMGEAVAPRREFIEHNAHSVMNLDV